MSKTQRARNKKKKEKKKQRETELGVIEEAEIAPTETPAATESVAAEEVPLQPEISTAPPEEPPIIEEPPLVKEPILVEEAPSYFTPTPSSRLTKEQLKAILRIKLANFRKRSNHVAELARQRFFRRWHDVQDRLGKHPARPAVSKGTALLKIKKTPRVVPAEQYAPSSLVLARPWMRLFAFLYDFLLLVLINSLLILTAAIVSINRFIIPLEGDLSAAFHPAEAKEYFIRAISIGIVFSWLYLTLLETLPFRATVGKLLFSLKTVNMNGERITFLQANKRLGAKFLSIVTLGIGCAAAVFRRDRKALHDVLAKTQVVRINDSESEA